MDILLALLVVIVAWFILDSLWNVLVVAVTVAVVVAVIRYLRYGR